MNTIMQYREDLMVAASRLGNINDFDTWPKDETALANGYIEFETRRNETLDLLKDMDEHPENFTQEEYDFVTTESQKFEREMESYLAALLLRHWKDINRLYQKCKTCDSRNNLADFTTIVYERIMYAFKYRAWLKEGSKLNAQQCINMAISTEVKNQMYFSNLQKNLTNAAVNTISLDKTIGKESDDRETTIADTIADPESGAVGFSKVDGVIQDYINRDKIVEAIIIDTIANNATMKITTETEMKTRIVETFNKDENKWVVEKNDDGSVKTEEVKCKVNYIEPWRYKTAEFLMNLPESYVEDFQKRFKVSAELLLEAYKAISTARNTKVYKYLDKTVADLRNNKDMLLQMLR